MVDVVLKQGKRDGQPALALHQPAASRVVAKATPTPRAQPSQTSPYVALCVGSWALVEVPRYSFFAVKELVGGKENDVPYVLFWLRYSLFAVLYPTGITGEILTFVIVRRR